MRAASTRYGKRKICVAGILVLAGVFLYHGMCSLNDAASSGGRQPGAAAAVAGADASAVSCEWEEGGPELFVIRHNTNHPDARHWFHIAECFTGRRADLKKTIRDMSGTVYLQVLDPRWMAKLTPMSRLLIASALTGAGTSNVHFVDADRASFSYSSGTTATKTPGGEAGPPPVHIDGKALAPARDGGNEADEDGARSSVTPTQGSCGTRGGPHRRQQQQQQQPQPQEQNTQDGRTRSAAAAPNGQPRSGQVGLLEFDPRGRGNEFVLSLESSVADRLTVTADINASTANQDGEGPRGNSPPQGGGSVRGGGGGGGDTSHGGKGDSAREPVCVKYLKTVGQKTVQRRDWFPSPEDARSLLEAIDTYCPVPFLREESEGQGVGEAGEGGEGQRRREGQGEGAGGSDAGRVRRLLLYQRDRNRQIRKAEKVVEDLQQRLGDGWVVEEMMHDSDRHPCELVETLGGVDVLLTAHGFQSMLGLFMRPGSLLYEVFPHKYFKAGYAPMAEGLGVRHAFSMSRPLRPFIGFSRPTTETCMNWILCRWYSRGSDVEIADESLNHLVELALEPIP
eukprot:g11960.t1